jgi:hypothetical protein
MGKTSEVEEPGYVKGDRVCVLRGLGSRKQEWRLSFRAEEC